MKNYLYLAIATLVLCSCSKENDGVMTDDGEMRFTADIATTRATETAFEAGDEIGLFATVYGGEVATPLQISGNWANNVATTYDGAAWQPAKKIYWSDSKMDVYGYYPYMSITSINEQPFSVALDQSTPESEGVLSGYEASDFLWAKATGVEQSGETVALQFKHRMSKFVIKLEKGPNYEGDFPEVAVMRVHNLVPTATIDFTTGAVTKDMFGEPTTITCRRVDEATFEAIVVPQRITSRLPFIEMEASGISYLIEDTFHFKPGRMYTYTLIINSNPDQIEVEIGGEVEGGW